MSRTRTLALALLSLMLLPGQVRPEPPAPPTPTGAATQKRFDPASAWLGEDSPERRMIHALQQQDLLAARMIGEAALPQAERLRRGRLLWLLARAAREDVPSKRAYLVSLYGSDHPLSRWAGLELAESLRWSEPRQALPIARALSKGWAGAHRAQVIEALALQQAGEPGAEDKLRALLARVPAHVGGATAGMPLAQLLIELGTPEALEEALSIYRRVASRAPLSEPGREAEAATGPLLARLPAEKRRALRQPSIEDEMYRAGALHDARRYDEAEQLFEAVAERVKDDATLRCEAELGAGRAMIYKRERKRAATWMRELAERCESPETTAWARYYGGRARLRSDDPEGALAELDALVREVPEHSLADDALYLKATALADLGDPQAKRETLAQMVERYPQGDMHADGRFSLAFDARARGEHGEALKHLERLLSEGARDDAEGVEGRAAYWRARTLQDLGRKQEAAEGFAAVARAFPLSYHAQQAMTRLLELSPKRASGLQRELQAEAEDATPLIFPWRAEMDEAAFRSALALLRIGEVDLAQRELEHLGALGDGADEELLWLSAALLHGARAYASASRLVRARLDGHLSQPPRGRARHLWRIAYPRAFSPLIEEVAREADVPAAFVRAVAREESAFNPRAVSTARAYGLIQLIRPTARAHAKALGLPSTPSALMRPEINLRIGSRFIRTLWERYQDNPAVVPAAYNAGHGAADRWIRAAPDRDLDEWIERIPYRETRRYTRRVLQSYGIYAWLDEGELPVLPARLPRR
ncbi:MAG: transglycosylase SLT domain-containing protein [Myxococcales bacterium]|jgi:soluble lytic murein transglycosylase